MKRGSGMKSRGDARGRSHPQQPAARQLASVKSMSLSFPGDTSSIPAGREAQSKSQTLSGMVKPADPSLSVSPQSWRQSATPTHLQPLPGKHTPHLQKQTRGDSPFNTSISPMKPPSFKGSGSDTEPHFTPQSGYSKVHVQPGGRSVKVMGSMKCQGQSGQRVASKSSTAATKPANKKLSNKPVLPEIGVSMSSSERLLRGYTHDIPPPNSSIIRIFLSSTFSDYKLERNHLVLECYPRLQQYCASVGLDFQIVDLRWGITRDSANDHSVEDLCLLEIEQCQKLSQGVAFIVMLGDRYGFRPVPSQIEAAEFECLWSIAERDKVTGCSLLKSWYTKDSNYVNPMYILKPIDSHFPHYTELDVEKEGLHKEAAGKWNDTVRKLQEILQYCVGKAIDEGRLQASCKHKYVESVTSMEIEKGLLNDEKCGQRALCFHRQLTALYDDMDLKLVERFGNVQKNADTGAREQLSECVELQTSLIERIKKKLPPGNFLQYNIPWTGEGVCLNTNAKHKEYLDQFCIDFENQVRRLVEAWGKEENKRMEEECRFVAKHKPVAKKLTAEKSDKRTRQAFPGMSNTDFMMGHMSMQEIITDHQEIEKLEPNVVKMEKSRAVLFADLRHHLNFSKTKSELFCGREEELKKIKSFLGNTRRNKPIVVHAPSGGGKTAFMAKVADTSHEWLGNDAVAVLRFLGTSRSSSSLRQVLTSVCRHLATAYNLPLQSNGLTKMRKILQCLDSLMMQVSIKFMSTKPLMIMLDSVDQLDSSDGAHGMQWIPKSTPAGVYFIVSLLPTVHSCLENAKRHLGEDGQFLELGTMGGDVAQKYTDIFLAARKRTLTESQMTHLVGTLRKNTQPLLMTLILEQASLWKSYTDVTELQLASTAQEAVVKLFEKLEKKFSVSFIETALGYLTASGHGMTEVDLEDALSCSDELLNSVYKFHDPPVKGVIRMPGLLWARARGDLGHYIVERQSHGKTTVFWYHRQFTEAAQQRYCSSEKSPVLHAQLADIYLAENGVKRTITLSHRNLTVDNADRLVTPKPLSVDNKHLLVMLPYHLTRANNVMRLKRETYCRFRYLLCFMGAFSLSELLHNIKDYLENQEDNDLTLLHDCLQFSQAHIKANETALGSQILGQLARYSQSNKAIQELCLQARQAMEECNEPALIPIYGNMPSSSSALKWYTKGVGKLLCQSSDTSLVLTENSRQGSGGHPILTFFNMTSMIQGQSIRNPTGEDSSNSIITCLFSNNNERLFILCVKNFHIYAVNSGECLQIHSTDINHTGHVNMTLVVSSDSQYIALGGPERLALLEEKSPTADESDFKVRRAMSLNGAPACSNLVFNHDSTMTVSTHLIKSNKKTIGAVVLWDFWQKRLKSRVALPVPVESGLLHLLHPLAGHDLALCGCKNGLIFMVDVVEGKIISQMGQDDSYTSTILSCHNLASNLLITAQKGQTSLQVWNTDISNNKLVTTIRTSSAISDVAFCTDMSSIVIGDDQGYINVYQFAQDSFNTQLHHSQLHSGAILSVRCDDKEQVLTIGADGFMKVSGLEALMEPERPVVEEDGDGGQELADHLQVYSMEMINCDLITASSRGVRSWTLSEMGVSCKDIYASDTLASNITFNSRSASVAAIQGEDRRLVIHETPAAHSTLSLSELESITMKDVMIISGRYDHLYAVGSSGTNTTLYQIDIEKRQIIKSMKMALDCSSGVLKLMTTLKEGTCVALLYCSKPLSFGTETFQALCVDLSNNKTTICHFHNTKSLNPEKSPQKVFSMTKFDDETLLLGCLGDVMSWQPLKSDECNLIEKAGVKTWLRHSLRFYWKTAKKPGAPLDPSPVTALVAGDGGSVVVSGVEAGSIVRWRNVPVEKVPDSNHNVLMTGHTAAVTCLLIDSSERTLVSASQDHTVRVWQLQSGEQTASLYCHMTADHMILQQRLLVTRCSDMKSSRVLVYRMPEESTKSNKI